MPGWAALKAVGGVALLCGVLSLAGCEAACACAPTPERITPAPGAITQDAAIEAAKRLAPAAASEVTVGWVGVARNPFASDESSASLVWMVNLYGTFAVPSCPPGVDARPWGVPKSLPPCLLSDKLLVAVLDHFTGQLIGWE